jgi:hypothetical protein
VPVALFADKCDEVDPEKKQAAEDAAKQAEEARKAAEAAKRKAGLERAQQQPKPSWYENLTNPRAGTKDGGDGKWERIKPALFSYESEMGARYQEQISGVNRGKEYQVPLDTLDGKPVNFDGWDSAKGTYLEAKYGYRNPKYYDAEAGELKPDIANRWAKQAQRQVDAARGKPVVWHFSDSDVADAAREMFETRGIEVTVETTPSDVVG